METLLSDAFSLSNDVEDAQYYPNAEGIRFLKMQKWVVEMIPRTLRLMWPIIVENPFPIQDMLDVSQQPSQPEEGFEA